MKRFEELTLEDIKKLDDINLYDEYNKQIADLSTDRLSRKITTDMYGESIKAIFFEIEKSYSNNTSRVFLSNDLVLLHGGIIERRSKEQLECDFSGIIIRKGSLYVNYRPLIEDLTTGYCYVLSKTIKVREEYIDYLPNNIEDLEILQTNMMIEKEDNVINYEYLNRKFNGGFTLRKLRRKSYENRYSK